MYQLTGKHVVDLSIVPELKFSGANDAEKRSSVEDKICSSNRSLKVALRSLWLAGEKLFLLHVKLLILQHLDHVKKLLVNHTSPECSILTPAQS